MTQWTREWPTTPGRYWFFGRRSRSAERDELFAAIVVQASNTMVHIIEGSFAYQEEGAVGRWAPMELPDLPGGK